MLKQINLGISLTSIPNDDPIFAYRENKLVGMLVEEPRSGWILRTGGDNGANGWFETRKQCFESGLAFSCTFKTADGQTITIDSPIDTSKAIIVKEYNKIIGIVCKDHIARFYIQYFNSSKSIKYGSLEELMANYPSFTFWQ